ncbi:MAG: FAD-dependent oxidoreductase, partial [Deltaproteobacteria bacterium]
MKADVIIIGAGTAGAATALQCARRGLRVIVLERRPLDRAGAHWHNGVPAWSFDAAGIARPVAPELAGAGHAFHLVAGWGPTRVVVEDHDVLEVDMGLLVARLQREARAAGAVLVDDVRVVGCDGGHLDTTAGPFDARWIVDASGFGGVGLIPAARVQRDDICTATQRVYGVSDVPAAQAWFRERGVEPGDTLCHTSVAGGFSIVNLRLHGDELAILTGTIPSDEIPSGRALLEDFVGALPWLGARRSGGSSPIPLRRPYDHLASERVALIGDAACQVFAAHGSGISAQLVASRILAEALADGEGPLGYQRRWQRRWGGLFAAYDLFRRFSERLDADALERLMRVGVMRPDAVREGMAQRWPRLGPRRLAAIARAAAR